MAPNLRVLEAFPKELGYRKWWIWSERAGGWGQDLCDDVPYCQLPAHLISYKTKIGEMVIESQIPHKIVNLLFTLTH